jgi:hypothetical protein
VGNLKTRNGRARLTSDRPGRVEGSGMLGEGLEPSRGYPHRILNPARLPIPPPERPSGAEGSRTPDLLNAIQALSQLSYGPDTLNLNQDFQSAKQAGLTGLEPAASGVTDRHSNQTELQPLATATTTCHAPRENRTPLSTLKEWCPNR